ncbi:MAG: aspartate--tRNA ligase [Candidatus Pacebacteria bacterium]|nr:aspartate--tRNA ligase [Candidatus Paceibacterota bacterium]
MKERIYIGDLADHIDQEVTVAGWINVRRDHGKLIFIDLRDMSGVVQMVALPSHSEAHEVASEVRPEWVVEVRGKVNKRPEKMINADEQNGDIEIEVLDMKVLNQSKTPPFEISEDTKDVDENVRLKYRYLDLRTKRMQENIRMRDSIVAFFRDYMHKNDFVEIETPMLMKGTPEGSREYLVPSRIEPGKFYALPQSPQQYKQLCMVAGFEKYFQITKCMRDEDLRGDRQPEFTQLDYEMSFVTQEEILQFTEKMFIELVEKLFPEKKISKVPFTRITYAESMEKYGTDKPDLRENKEDPNELAFVWVVDFPLFEINEEGQLAAAHHPFCSVKEEDNEKFMNAKSGKDILDVRANAYDMVLNGYELSSGSIRIHKQDMQEKVFDLLGIDREEQQTRFGHMLEAFKYGAPPHGGSAPGIDRFIMVLADEPNIREVMAFPKTREAKEPMTNSPAPTDKKILDELGLELKKEEK